MFLKRLNFLLLACVSLADLPPLYRSQHYDLGAFDRWPHQVYRSSRAIGPILNIYQQSEECRNEQLYTVLAYWGKRVNLPGVMILDTQGYLVWHTSGYVTAEVQSLRGKDYLAALAEDQSHYVLINSRYEEAYRIRAGNGWKLDPHELALTPEGTALVVVHNVVPMNQTALEGPPEVKFILDVGFQEIDIEMGKVLFEWRASDHYSFEESYHFQPGDGRTEKTAPDLFHINSVEKDTAGNYLISSRLVSSVAYVNGRTGAVIWKLGGKKNMFQDLSGGAATSINGQHHARFHDNGQIMSLFDNGNSPGRPVTGPTRGLSLVLDTENMTVQVQHEYRSPNRVPADNSGSMQVLNNGNVILGFGANGNWAEYALEGSLLCNVHLGPEAFFNNGEFRTYRISKSTWVGHPQTMPEIAVEDGRVYVSWNGATEVSMWALKGTDVQEIGGESVFLGAFPKQGFETEIPIPPNSTARYVYTSALDRAGQILGSTSAVRWQSGLVEGITKQGF